MSRKNNNKTMIETLEGRVMMAGQPLSIGTAGFMGGTQLVINGSSNNDAITVKQTEAGLVIGNTGGWSQTVAGNFKSIKINAGNGNDTVTVDASVNTNAVIHGGAGNDTLIGGNGNDQLFGNAGNDLLKGMNGDDQFVTIGGGVDKIEGNEGNDSFWLDKSGDSIKDVSGWENGAGNVHKVNTFETIKTVTGTGKKAKTVNTVISKELTGQKIVDPTISDAGVSYRNFAGNSLFSDAGPIADDVKQGYLGDCYFLATLSSVADTNANTIKQSVVDLGDGTYAVRFYKGGKEMFYRVDGDLATWSNGSLAYANTGAQSSTWVAIIEKAFAAFRTNVNSYASLNGGWMSEVYSALGKTSQNTFAVSTGAQLLTVIKDALAAGKSVTYAANEPTDGAPLIGSHAYSVERVNVDANGNAVSVTFRNPWGVDGKGNDGANDGYVTVTAAQAKNAFLGLTIAAV